MERSHFLVYLNYAFKKFVFMGDPDINYITLCVYLCPPKSRYQSRIRHLRDLLVKYLCRIKGREQEKVERAFRSRLGQNLVK